MIVIVGKWADGREKRVELRKHDSPMSVNVAAMLAMRHLGTTEFPNTIELLKDKERVYEYDFRAERVIYQNHELLKTQPLLQPSSPDTDLPLET